jgi:hypothetical protein
VAVAITITMNTVMQKNLAAAVAVILAHAMKRKRKLPAATKAAVANHFPLQLHGEGIF